MRFLLFTALVALSTTTVAQLQDGSVAPDFTATDIEGVEHNLYSLLDEGYQVILNFGATWSGPDWSYHEGGVLSELHDTYGPDGTDEIRVFFLESDDQTTAADLNGTGPNTFGDWVTGTPYPIIDNAGSIFDDYAAAYYPTIYTVCPSRIITESGQASVADHAAIFQANSCAAASLPNDGALVGYAGETAACGDAPISLAVTLMNMGVDPLTSCTITAYDGATAVGSTDWMGNLDTYATEEVLVTTTTIDASTEFTFEITSIDDNAENNAVASGMVNTSVESTNNVRFTLNLDAYPGEVVWAVLDDMGNVVEVGGPYAAGDVGAEFVYDWTLDLGCYTFVIEDAYGDGLHSSWYNGTGPDGSFSLDAMDGNAVSSNLLSYSAPDQYAVIEFPFEVISNYSPCEEDEDNDLVCDDIDTCIGIEDECGICNGPGAIYDCGCFDAPEGDCDCDGNQPDLLGVCGGDCTFDTDNNGVCDYAEVYGCMYQWANNFSPEASRDDGTCESPCVGEINQNVFDWDEDYYVTIADFLAMLSVFGDVDIDTDGVWDSSDFCVDVSACNYANDPSEPCAYIDVLGICGGGCAADEDNDDICDDIDSCIGIEDECGVCNGPGPTEVVIEDIVIAYDSVYAEQIDQWFVFEVGADTTFSIVCAPSFSSCGDPLSYQGYNYETVQIGEQCWFAENLRSENYKNGDVIPANLSNAEWQSSISGAMAVYGDGSLSLSEHGGLYNWYAVDDARGLCPNGWHVPSDEEWNVLTDHLGGEYEAGFKMKTTYGWHEAGNGSNESNFSGLPGGTRGNDGSYAGADYVGRWYSSTQDGPVAWNRDLIWDTDGVDRNSSSHTGGFSIRCIQDSE